MRQLSLIPYLYDMEFITTIEQLPKVLIWIQKQLERIGLSSKKLRNIELAAEEVFVNIVHHAYQGRIGKVEIQVQLISDAQVEIAFIDDGPSFNPLESKLVDVSQPLERRQVGGLGIHLIRKCTDAIHYKRLDGKNILVLIIRSS